jgi:transcriptional regulator with XRE-family HTH domain
MEDLAQRLRQLRRRHGLSQRELAKRSGVSNAMISLIENGRSNPSMGLMRRILEGIPVSMSEFFSETPIEERKVFFHHHELTQIGSGAISFLQVGSDLATRRLQLLYERYAPGADTGSSMLSHDAEEGGLILSGNLEVTVGESTRVLGPGEAFLFDSQTPHRFRNTGSKECVLVTACTPPSF